MRKRAKLDAAEAKAAKQEDDEKQMAQSKQDERKHLARQQELAQILANREQAALEKDRGKRSQAYWRWVQTGFPVELAERCIKAFRDMTTPQKQSLEWAVVEKIRAKQFYRGVWLPDLWECKGANNMPPKWVDWKCEIEKIYKPVRCSLFFHP